MFHLPMVLIKFHLLMMTKRNLVMKATLHECDDDNCSASSQESVVAPPYSPMDYDDDGHDNYYDNDDNNDDGDDDVDDMDGLKVSYSWSFLYALCVFFTF